MIIRDGGELEIYYACGNENDKFVLLLFKGLIYKLDSDTDDSAFSA